MLYENWYDDLNTNMIQIFAHLTELSLPKKKQKKF